MKTAPSLRAIPSVEKLLHALGPTALPRMAVVTVVRRHVAALRRTREVPAFDAVLGSIRVALDDLRLSRLQPVINGTGILVHTNLGRAPLGDAVVETLAAVAAHYNNLELDLATGERGSRAAYLDHTLALLCGGEAATIVNNCAAALVLILRHFTSGERKEVIISRGELIQIGGGFRIPEILEATGATLREVGTTNRTTLSDYANAIGRQTAMILRVHRSNFFLGGFVASPGPAEIAALARRKRLPFVEDLGSGAAVATEKLLAAPAPGAQTGPFVPLEHEPTPAEVLQRGVDLVCFSGDKLLGGPQAGIIAGRAKLVAALKREPFFRALRCDKLILAALQTTVDHYLDGAPEDSIPVLSLVRAPNGELRVRAERIIAALAGLPLQAGVGAGRAQVGGGTLPRSVIPSVTVDLLPERLALEDFAARLRRATPPTIGYLGGGRLKLDLRTVFPRQDELAIGAIRQAVAP